MSISERRINGPLLPPQRLVLELTELPHSLAYVVSIVVVLASCFFLHQLQSFVADYDQVKRGPAFIAFFFIAIAISTFIGGRNPGFFSVLLSVACAAYFLIPPQGIAVAPTMSNYVTLAIVIIVGCLVTFSTDALRKNTRLLAQNVDLLSSEQARANREALMNKIGDSVRTAKNADQVQAIAVSSLGQALNVDACYFLRFNSSRSSAIIGHYWRRDGQTEREILFPKSDLGRGLQLLEKSGNSVSYSDCTVDPFLIVLSRHLEKMGGRAGIIAPLFSDSKIESALITVMFDQPRFWTNSDIYLVETVAVQSRTAVDALRLRQKEHNIAIQLQAALQPQLSINVPGVDIASYYRAALDEANVGGDFYDGLSLGKNRFALIIGDVSGKGLAAASQVSAIRNMIRCLLQTVDNLQTAVSQLNEVLIKQELLPAFATLTVIVFDMETMSFEYLSCGHEPALLYRAKANNAIEVLECAGPVLGVGELVSGSDNPSNFPTSHHRLQPGDSLLLYTDGICDAGPDTSSLLGVEGIAGLVTRFFNTKRSSEQRENVANSLLEFCIDETERIARGVLRDDICLLALVIEDGRRSMKDTVSQDL